MANITILDPSSGKTKTIAVNIEASIVIQDLSVNTSFFLTLSTAAKDVAGAAIASETITALSDGAGGVGLDRNGGALSDGKYAGLTEAINDYVAMMAEGKQGEPWTEMAFT